MKPVDLTAKQFREYPPAAKQTAVDHLAVLRQLPLSFLPFLLKEMVSLDTKFPTERQELVFQLDYLAALSPVERDRNMSAFAGLRLTPELESFDWINLPGQFLERLSSHLWATSQMDTFRSASEQYMKDFRAAHPDQAPQIPRLAIVLVGQGVATNTYPLFRKLRRQGAYFGKVDGINGLGHIRQFVEARVAAQPAPYAHWLIDGAQPSWMNPQLALVSYEDLSSVRSALTAKMAQAFESRMSPEALRTMLAKMTPSDLGMQPNTSSEVLDHFKVGLFTEGSGTQIYSTTFVQWTAREALRRAKPLTLVARFTPRQRDAPMNELLNGSFKHTLDPAGSLVDADMGAWYTWIDLQRLPGADSSSFLVWFENGSEAVAVGPSFTRATEDNAPVKLGELLDRLAGKAPATRA